MTTVQPSSRISISGDPSQRTGSGHKKIEYSNSKTQKQERQLAGLAQIVHATKIDT